MFPGVECDIIPTQPSGSGAASRPNRQKDPKVWLAGELIVRCEHQGLSVLPSQLFLKITLRQLVLTGNKLTHLPCEIQQLKELRELRLGYNQLQELPEEVCSLPQLVHLDVQHNQLQAVPAALCRLVHLSIVNLDGNPLSSRSGPDRPTLLEVWSAAAGSSSSPDGQQQHPKRASGRQAAASALKRLTQGTEAVLQHLMEQQDPNTVLQIKQAKLELLKQASTERIHKMLCVDDAESLGQCLSIATATGLSQDLVLRVQEAQAATAAMQQALDAAQAVQQKGDGSKSPAAVAADSGHLHEQLGAALRGFEELCKPGRPAGSVYTSAHAMWRTLQRQQLERGWRCNSPKSPAGFAPGAVNSTADVGGAAGGASSEPAGASPPRRRFMTLTEHKKQQLEAAGAKTYQEWRGKKEEQEQLERQHAFELAHHEAQAKVQAISSRAAKAVENCAREKYWPSKVEAYPPGTFGLPPERLKAVRRAYQRPPDLLQDDDE